MANRRQKKQEEVKRKAFTTNINADLLQQFKIYCVTHNVYQNDVLEKLIEDLLKGSESIGDSNK